MQSIRNMPEYHHGYRAFMTTVSREENPHTDTRKFLAWDRGWCNALKDDDEELE